MRECHFQVRTGHRRREAVGECESLAANAAYLMVDIRPFAAMSYFSKNLRMARITSLYCLDFVSGLASAPKASGMFCHIAQAMLTHRDTRAENNSSVYLASHRIAGKIAECNYRLKKGSMKSEESFGMVRQKRHHRAVLVLAAQT